MMHIRTSNTSYIKSRFYKGAPLVKEVAQTFFSGVARGPLRTPLHPCLIIIVLNELECKDGVH